MDNCAESPKLVSEKVVWKRSDLSFLLVHLTRDRDSLVSILTKQNGDCTLKGNRIGYFGDFEGLSEEDVTGVGLTEAPLDQIKHFAKPLEGDSPRRYSKYGIVFDQAFVRKAGGNPCFYVNTLTDYALRDTLIDLAKQCSNNSDTSVRKLLLYFNIFGRTGQSTGQKEIDFYWEREWRVPGNLSFRYEDVFVGLCEDEDVKWFTQMYPEIPFVCPDWNYDRILKRLRDWTHPGNRQVVYKECAYGQADVCPLFG